MKTERKQLEIIENQLNRALDIVLQQKKRYEVLQSEMYQYNWICEDAEDDEYSICILRTIENIQDAIDSLYV